MENRFLLLNLCQPNILSIPVGVPARGKSRPVEPGRIIQVATERGAVEVGSGPQALGGRSGLVLGVIFCRLLVSTGVMSGAGAAEGQGVKLMSGKLVTLLILTALTMKTTSPFDYAELINILSEGLSMDLFSREEITQWADHFVLQDDEPDIFFIDLALSINKEAALTLLNQNVRTMQATTTSRPLFGSLYKQATSREKGTTAVVRTLFGFVFDDLLTKPEKLFIYALDHAADYLEASSAINIWELEEDVLTFLSIYKEYTIINYAHWNVLDKQVEQALKELGNDLGNLDNQRTKLFHSWKFWQ